MKRIHVKDLGINLTGIKEALEVVVRLHSKGHAAFIVGGAVRDLLLGFSPKDFDVATDARPNQIRRIFKRSRIIGRRFRLVHVRVGNQIIEVSTFRKAPSAKIVEDGGMLGEDNTFGTVEEDAFRRDITMNSLLLDPKEGYVYDYTGGLEDVKRRRMRIIGEPEIRYREDPVRMLRIIRLATKLGCEIESESKLPLTELAPLLSDISSARLLDELIKIMFSCASAECLLQLRKHGLLSQLMPHMLEFDEEQDNFWQTALSLTDRLNRSNSRVSLSFIISSLFWPAISSVWNEQVHNKTANLEKIREMYASSGLEENPILTRALRAKVWEIWELQARFQKLHMKRRALRIKSNYVTDKALAFLRFRSEAEEIGSELSSWWDEFLSAEMEARVKMLPRRRRSKKKVNAKQADPSGSTED